jgi:hypothetical protein
VLDVSERFADKMAALGESLNLSPHVVESLHPDFAPVCVYGPVDMEGHLGHVSLRLWCCFIADVVL